MIYYKDKRWNLYTDKVLYTMTGTEYTSTPEFFVGNPLYSNVVVEPIILTADQMERFNFIQDLQSVSIQAIQLFVMENKILDTAITELVNLKNKIKTQEIVTKYVRWDDVTLDEYQVLIGMYPPYEIGKAYMIGNIFNYDSNLYKVLQAHTSQADWIPNEVSALYLRIEPTGVIPEWVQPTGGDGNYVIGSRVVFQGQIYESIFQGLNVWSPIDYPAGWKLII